ncbi:glycoside hydrolase family 3 C-terminal domain-containing protein [Halobacteria archaeon AArc-m2/3/4]|uniref:Glycoside hydrolase family 3 C-terminal domain-containing protein n=1 Tax=Natronoglomus mannanivorans TaxID=2979990 RepID=A0ABT2Q931_9EURY|nr:glycoside hydrolase family 3 C-terminal domain-containing protein [Halobacteria archaeon AArc-m2/3/4]
MSTDPDTTDTDIETDASTNDVADIVDEMTLEEKIDFVHGSYDPAELATGYVAGIDRLNLPSLSLVDGPMGIRAVPSTAFPASIALAATWDPDLAREFGEAIGEEARGADQDALLAPGFNVIRVPQCGRAFEYYSEDPYLNSRLAVGTVDGVQSAGVMATAKHYLANNQEADRHHVSAEIDERTLREIYLPAFEAAVTEADVSSVMASYNRINGTYAPQHRRLLTEVLKDEWGFEGFVVSDWWATHDGVAAAEAGLDLDMPGMPVYDWQCHGSTFLDLVAALPDEAWFPKKDFAQFVSRPWQPANPNPNVLEDSPFDEPLREAIDDGRLEESILDEKIRRILREMARFGVLDGDQPEGALDTPDHHDLARRIAERGTVLLQNDDALPLDGTERIALVGPNADEPKVGGGGSSEVDPTRATSPLEAIRDRLEPDGSVSFERGLESVGDASMHDSFLPDVHLPGGEDPRIEDAMRAARDTDVAVVVVRDLATEGADRGLELPGAQNELITAVAAVAERTVVVLNTAGMVEMPWREDVDAILESWYPGQEDGNALASVLFGDADPSGRLPVTIGERAEDYPASSVEQYPGVDLEADYSEGVFVGYRHFDEEGIEPVFPFGHGVSYTDFEYGGLSVEIETDGDDNGDTEPGPMATAEITVENTGGRSGRDVVQAYLSVTDSSVPRPPRELAAFEPVELEAGQSTTVSLDLDRRAFAYYDEDEADWIVEDREFDVLVGRSSRDIRERASLER